MSASSDLVSPDGAAAHRAGPQHPRERLHALHAAIADAERPGEPESPGEPEHPAAPEARPATGTAPQHVGRLVRRWIPPPLRTARWDPGRPGAIALSAVAAVAAILAAAGVWLDRPVAQPVAALPALNPAPVSSAPAPPDELVVSVVGKVANPGLVRLPEGARVADALAAAGGRLPGTEIIGLNLARKLSDGEQLLVGITPPPGRAAPGAVSGGQTLVNLNTATQEQLEQLPEIGPVTAQRILDWRAEYGRFDSVNQLLEVSGIGPATLEQIEDLVRV